MMLSHLAKRAGRVRKALARVGTVRSFSAASTLVDSDLMTFLLYDVLDVEQQVFQKKKRFSHMSREIVDDAFGTSVKLGLEKLQPHNRRNDVEEPKWNPETGVELHPEVGEALNALREAGFLSAHADFELGGMQFPSVITNALFFPLYAANVGTMTFPFLTIAAGNMLAAKGSKDQLERFLVPMLEGSSTGTMNLSEPQAGSSLGDITTKAFRREDGTYSIRGTKMWISGGEIPDVLGPHRNITHMVLAKVVDPSQPEKTAAGTKGISLFIVPKFRVHPDGSLGKKNGIELAGLNHKLGWRGVTNCVLNYGESDETIGELLGEEGQGLATMFLMMNEARITIGVIASALGYAGYARSLEYALDRKQGRLASEKDPEKEPTAIINHPDVKRMLLVQKAYVEGAISLCLFGSVLVDRLHGNDGLSPEEEQEMRLLLDTLTPIIKSWPSEWALEANKWAIQIHGGYGYTRDYDVEQIYRDNRLNMIHEGTNGIQSLDLLGRKVQAKGGRGFSVLVKAIQATIQEASVFAQGTAPQLDRHVNQLQQAVAKVTDVTGILVKAGAKDRELMLANSHEYLNMVGHVVIAWQWLRMELAAQKRLSDEAELSEKSRAFFLGKLAASDYFFKYELPKIETQATLLASLDRLTLDTKNDWL